MSTHICFMHTTVLGWLGKSEGGREVRGKEGNAASERFDKLKSGTAVLQWY